MQTRDDKTVCVLEDLVCGVATTHAAVLGGYFRHKIHVLCKAMSMTLLHAFKRNPHREGRLQGPPLSTFIGSIMAHLVAEGRWNDQKH